MLFPTAAADTIAVVARNKYSWSVDSTTALAVEDPHLMFVVASAGNGRCGNRVLDATYLVWRQYHS